MFKVVVFFIVAFATTGILCADTKVPAVLKVIGKSIRTSCVAETGANEDVINALVEGQFPKDEAMWCYLKCTVKKMGALKGDTIDAKKLAGSLPEKIRSTYAPGIKHCKDAPVGADACETAFLFNKCVYDYNPELYFIF